VAPRYVSTAYVAEALAQAAYEKLKNGSYAGRIPPCPGVVAIGTSLRGCENELRSTLEDWVLVGLQLKHPVPVIQGIDLNKEDDHG
jgi:predicted RNase H-like HicB family nuclease